MLCVDALLDGLVLVGELLGIGDHLVDLLLRQASLIISDRDGLGLADTFLDTGDGEDAILVDLESDLNLRHTSGCGRNSSQVKLAELMVVLDEGALALEHGNGDSSLLVLVCGEGLTLLGGDDGTALDDRGHDTSDGLDTESKWGNINEKNVLSLLISLSTENTTLNGGTVGNGLVWVDASVGLLAVEEVLNELLDLGDTGGATNEHNLIDLTPLETRVIHDSLDGFERVFEEIVAELLELSASQSFLEVDAINERLDRNLNLLHGGQVSLCLLNLGLKLLQGTSIGLNVHIVLFLEGLDEMVGHALIEILATKMSVTSGGEHLEDTVVNCEDRDIKGATTEIEDNNVLLVLLVKTVGDSSSGRLVDNTEDLESSDRSSVLSSLSLGVIEVSGHGNNGILDVLTKVVLSDFLHLGEDHSGDLLGAELLLSSLHLN